MSRHLHIPGPVLALAALALLVGCTDESVTHTRVAKEAGEPPAMPMAAAPAPAPKTESAVEHAAPPEAPPGMKGDVPAPPKPSGGEALAWTLPAGWKQTLTSGIRYATLVPAGGEGIEASVVVLPGPAGGELANVNRWRGSIGLAPLDDAGIAAARKAVTSPAGAVSLYDFSGEGSPRSRLVAGVVVVNGNSWFFKMTGEHEKVGQAVPGFTALLGSLHPGSNAN
ncbi:MAG: hypothetical protein JST54_01535 [Deltaproteobacteria bacterium]|nr:hypothetical protein [Deltaproteobacteria bacterium]